MARFDVYEPQQSKGYLLDCQADILGNLGTRFVIPLLPAAGLPSADRLNPVFQIAEQSVVMATHLAAAIPVPELGKQVASLAGEQSTIMNAIDMLLTGY